MVYVYAADIRNLKDPKKYPDLLQYLSAKDKLEILNLRNTQKRIHHFGFSLLLKEVLSRHNILETVDSGDFSKNIIVNKYYISFSYTENILICAISEKEIGCDIKKIKAAPQNPSSAYFSKWEKSYLKSFQSQYYNDEFFRLHTLKASYIKMTGEQISHPARVFEVIIGEEIEVYRNEYAEPCCLEEYYIPGYQLSVCSKDTKFSPEITFISLL